MLKIVDARKTVTKVKDTTYRGYKISAQTEDRECFVYALSENDGNDMLSVYGLSDIQDLVGYEVISYKMNAWKKPCFLILKA